MTRDTTRYARIRRGAVSGHIGSPRDLPNRHGQGRRVLGNELTDEGAQIAGSGKRHGSQQSVELLEKATIGSLEMLPVTADKDLFMGRAHVALSVEG